MLEQKCRKENVSDKQKNNNKNKNKSKNQK